MKLKKHLIIIGEDNINFLRVIYLLILLTIVIFSPITITSSRQSIPLFVNNTDSKINSTPEEAICFNFIIVSSNITKPFSGPSNLNFSEILQVNPNEILMLNNSCSSVLIYYYPKSNIIESTITESQSSTHGLISELEKMLPAVVGGLIALIGVLLTHIMTEKREVKKTSFEWGKFLFERYEQHYRSFILSLEDNLNPNEIEINFNNLNKAAYVPSSLKNKVKGTCKDLRSNIDKEEKENLRNGLLLEFEKFMQKPWDFKD